MKAKAYTLKAGSYIPCEPEKATHIQLNIPGPIPYRMIPVIQKGTRDGTGCWTWNGSLEKPDLKPSILTKAPQGDNVIVCHTWINEGMVHFLNDCTHEYAGQILDLLDIEE